MPTIASTTFEAGNRVSAPTAVDRAVPVADRSRTPHGEGRRRHHLTRRSWRLTCSVSERGAARPADEYCNSSIQTSPVGEAPHRSGQQAPHPGHRAVWPLRRPGPPALCGAQHRPDPPRRTDPGFPAHRSAHCTPLGRAAPGWGTQQTLSFQAVEPLLVAEGGDGGWRSAIGTSLSGSSIATV